MLNWAVSADQTWLFVNPANGSLAGGATQMVSVVVTSAPLLAGSYNAELTFADPTATSPQLGVDVDLTVTVPPPPPPPPPPGGPVSWTNDIWTPAFDGNCANCHGIPDPMTGMVVHPGTGPPPGDKDEMYDNLLDRDSSIGVPYITPGDDSPAASHLIQCLSGMSPCGGSAVHPGPHTGDGTLTAAQLDLIMRWIREFANNN